ncbi:MAG TPA: hypothetical protein VIL88_04420 [Devosia sp.]|jgi:hypothetical protein|uniref:DUF6894 family protein n=1 Tax=Devosia sp. TaxID=1871048 RepID=UPI002F921DCD
MARFFFHIVDGQFVPDTNGIECSTQAQVKNQAVRIAGEMIKDLGSEVWGTSRLDLFVCDDQNNTHLKLSFFAEDVSGTLGKLVPESST